MFMVKLSKGHNFVSNTDEVKVLVLCTCLIILYICFLVS